MNASLAKHPETAYLRQVFNITSIMIYVIGKFFIESLKERIGLIFYGLLLWFLLGEACIAVNIKRKKEKGEK